MPSSYIAASKPSPRTHHHGGDCKSLLHSRDEAESLNGNYRGWTNLKSLLSSSFSSLFIVGKMSGGKKVRS